MEWNIPIQKLEIPKVRIGFVQKNLKPLTPLSYTDGPISFPNLNILLPALQVREYDPVSGKLMLTLPESSQTLSKLSALQDNLLTNVFSNQRYWFPESNRTQDQIRSSFQPFLDNGILYLYCPLQTQDKKYGLYIWKENEWKRFDTTGLLQKGEYIRVALKLQGISFQTNVSTGVWTGRFRVQHRIACIYHCGIPKKVSGELQ